MATHHNLESLMVPTAMPQEKMSVFMYTDDGRDVDDIEALTYFVGSGRADIVGLATTHMIPDRRAFILRALLNSFQLYGVPVGVGSVYPIGEEDEMLVNYLRQHTVNGRTYEGDGLIECFPSAGAVINDAIEEHGPDLRLAALAPLTDLAKAADEDEAHFCRVGRLFIQGQALVDENGRLQPNPDSYNMAQDMEAAERIFSLQDTLQFILVGKHAPKKIPFYAADFDAYGATGHAAGRYLKRHAILGMESFKQRDPQLQAQLYGPGSPYGRDDVLSIPYDAVVAKAIINPAGLQPVQIGRHILYGNVQDQPGITPDAAPFIKAEIHHTILNALQAA